MSMKKARKFAVQPASKPNSDINVTPLVDVVLVLLIIFMVVTPLLEKDIEVKVPATEQVDDVSEVPKDQLVVGITAEGQITINAEKVDEAQYVERLKRILAARAQGDRLVFFMADDRTNYGKLIAALDGAKKAGAETLGMMTEVPEGTPNSGALGSAMPEPAHPTPPAP